MTTRQPHLGIDFGGVIIPMVGRRRTEDTSFSDRFLSTGARHHAIEKIGALVQVFGGNVWVVSKAGYRTEELTRVWLREKRFFERTGLCDDHLRFCRDRQEKAPICAELGVTHFVDDRIHVMQILRNTVDHLYLFGDKTKNRCARKWTVLVENWAEAFDAIIRDL